MFLTFSNSLVNNHTPEQRSELPGFSAPQVCIAGHSTPDLEQPAQYGPTCLEVNPFCSSHSSHRDKDWVTSGFILSIGCEGPASSSSLTVQTDLALDFLF